MAKESARFQWHHIVQKWNLKKNWEVGLIHFHILPF